MFLWETQYMTRMMIRIWSEVEMMLHDLEYQAKVKGFRCQVVRGKYTWNNPCTRETGLIIFTATNIEPSFQIWNMCEKYVYT